MLRLHPELKLKWSQALDSGEFTQGHGRMFRKYDDEDIDHCCLGVLCEVLDRELPLEDMKWKNNGRPRMEYWHYIFENINDIEPDRVKIEAERFFGNFIQLNDKHRLKFPDIALFIQSNPAI